ncbi:zinc finger CCCH domain-containing protein 48-like [Tripterygium wilfordii]|uniref:Zinc finger CCCH domain-containing protein 48-like n=1 Tax=Tripterygium wilfordii TaxID=458696 RepID=A0A7J7CYZ6_TRIWF|nr:zinc finger CCCH domain-containing protein 63-like [Tripterygium wilfordii]KAF5739304.1 zinc finger CCCH domain-containing protein 48-like [Tripterygium wilfordii]
MATETARTTFNRRPERFVYTRPGRVYTSRKKGIVCSFWLAGRCTRNPCNFVHGELPPHGPHSSVHGRTKQQPDRPRKINTNYDYSKTSSLPSTAPTGSCSEQKAPNRVCGNSVYGESAKGDRCQDLRSCSYGDGFSILAKLEGHKRPISGIALLAESDKLCSGSIDGIVKVWDCSTGQCVKLVNLGSEIGSLISEGPWVFLGLPNVVKACNIQTCVDYSLEGPVGQVHAMVVGNDVLFAGSQDGTITAWKGSSATDPPFQISASLQGHTSAVTCLTVGVKGLYSGSLDGTIKAWDLITLQCTHTLHRHNAAVMSLLCWDQFLLSCSLDQKIHVWFATEDGNLEVTYTHDVEHGALALCGVSDAEGKPILLCSCDDKIVRCYELPSFMEKDKIFSGGEVQAIDLGPEGLFFTGDTSGGLTVWKLNEPMKS